MASRGSHVLPAHLTYIESDGALYDTREDGWSRRPPLRANYCFHHQEIKTVADLKATLRAGPFAWPGGYPLYFVTSDGGALSFDSVLEELKTVIWAIQHRECSGWSVIGCDVNWENQHLYDDHTGERIESAYGEDEGDGDG